MSLDIPLLNDDEDLKEEMASTPVQILAGFDYMKEGPKRTVTVVTQKKLKESLKKQDSRGKSGVDAESVLFDSQDENDVKILKFREEKFKRKGKGKRKKKATKKKKKSPPPKKKKKKKKKKSPSAQPDIVPPPMSSDIVPPPPPKRMVVNISTSSDSLTDDEEAGKKKKKKKKKKRKKKEKKKKSKKRKRKDTIDSNQPSQKKRKVSKKKGKKKDKSKPLLGVTICISQIGNPERKEIRETAVKLGAEYAPQYSTKVTHLICPTTGGMAPKVKEALNNKKKTFVVSKDWISDCQRLKRKCRVTKYQMFGRRKLKSADYDIDDGPVGDEDSYDSEFVDKVDTSKDHLDFRPGSQIIDEDEDDDEFLKNVVDDEDEEEEEIDEDVVTSPT